MPLFRCLVRGENFPGVLIGQSEPIGFYTTRYVNADSPGQAETIALDLLRNDEKLAASPEHRTQEASVHFDRIEPVSSEMEGNPGEGFAFFIMGT